MKSSSNIIKIKPKCPHKQSKSPNHPKTARNYANNFDNYQIHTVNDHVSIKPKQAPLKNDQNFNQNNYQLCKQATLCYYGVKEVIKMQALEKQSKKLKLQNKKLKEQNRIYEEYFHQFEHRFKEQKEEIKKLKEQNQYLKSRNAKIQELNSTLSGATATGRAYSHKQSIVTRSMPKYLY